MLAKDVNYLKTLKYAFQRKWFRVKHVYCIWSCFEKERKSKYLTYLASAGLGNRLRAHLIAYVISIKTERKLLIRWFSNVHCHSTFYDLFEPSSLLYQKGRFHSIEYLKNPKELVDSANVAVEENSRDVLILDFEWQFVEYKYLVEVIRGFDLRKILVLRQDLQKEVDQLVEYIGGDFLGVHIRRGDFKVTGQIVALEKYIALISCKVDENPDIKIFIASDENRDQLEPLLSHFRNIYFRETKGRQSLNGMEDAVIDMFLLSEARQLILTPGSTFGELAALIGEVPYEFV